MTTFGVRPRMTGSRFTYGPAPSIAKRKDEIPLPAEVKRLSDKELRSLIRAGVADASRAAAIGWLSLATGHGELDAIRRLVCKRMSISRDEFMSKSRRPRICRPRQVAMYLAHNLTEHSLPMIGRMYGGRDHTTVLHSVRLIARLIQEDLATRSTVEGLLADLGVTLDGPTA